jgi:hypothetical protein
MSLKAIGGVMLALAVAAGSAYAQTNRPADGATAKRSAQAAPAKRTRVAARPGTRVVVTKRSFLDAGTEVKPGERHFNDYVYYPGYNVWSATNIDPMNSHNSPPDPFWLPGTRCWPNC